MTFGDPWPPPPPWPNNWYPAHDLFSTENPVAIVKKNLNAAEYVLNQIRAVCSVHSSSEAKYVVDAVNEYFGEQK